MNKEEYLDLLRYYLRDMPSTVVDDIVSDYRDHFEIALERGKSEEEICEELGPPHMIAQEYLSNEKGKPRPVSFREEDPSPRADRPKMNRNVKIILALIGAAFILPPILGLGLGLVGGIFGLVFGIIGIIVSLLATFLSLGIGLLATAVALPLTLVPSLSVPFVSIPKILYSLSPLTRIFASISLFLFGILVLSLGIFFIRWVLRTAKNLYISLKWKWNKRRENR